MKNGISYQVIDTSALESGIDTEKSETIIPNDHWVANVRVATGCGSQTVPSRSVCPAASFRETITDASRYPVSIDILGLSFQCVREGEFTFQCLQEDVLYHSLFPFCLIIERIVQLPVPGKSPYAFRGLVISRQVHEGELGRYPDCPNIPGVEREESSGFDWVKLPHLAHIIGVDKFSLANDFLGPPFLDMPDRKQLPVIASNADDVRMGKYDVGPGAPYMPYMKKPPEHVSDEVTDIRRVWVALPMARAMIHLKNMGFEVGDRSAEVSLHSFQTTYLNPTRNR